MAINVKNGANPSSVLPAAFAGGQGRARQGIEAQRLAHVASVDRQRRAQNFQANQAALANQRRVDANQTAFQQQQVLQGQNFQERLLFDQLNNQQALELGELEYQRRLQDRALDRDDLVFELTERQRQQ